MAESSPWTASSPAKARTERIWLRYSPFWMAAMGVTMFSGAYRGWSDPVYMVFGLALGLPPFLLPWLLPGDPEADRPVWERHWFRANLWIALLVFVGSYFVTHYFFDVMGMRYGFPTRWHVEATVVGRRGGEVPLFLYPVTHAYFATYFAVMVVAWRVFRRRVSRAPWANALFVVAVSYIIAWAETFFMASGLIEDVFLYESRPRMLRYGSIFYGCLFMAALPLFARLDERFDADANADAAADAGAPRHRPSLVHLVIESLGAGLAGMILLELWAWRIGPLTPSA